MQQTSQYTIQLDGIAANFFEQVAQIAKLSTEQVLADALFQYAGKLSLQAIKQKQDSMLF